MATLSVILGLAYPVAIYLALQRWEPRQVALLGLALLALRTAIVARRRLIPYARALAGPALAVGATMAAAALLNHPLALLLTPPAVSFALLASFAQSLRGPMPVIERFARVVVSDLSPEEIAYCRSTTLVWCGFLAANGSVEVGLALRAPIEVWTLYTGFVSYLLIGALFAIEFVYRHWRFRRYVGAPTDVLLRRVFPPRPAVSPPRPLPR
jgi:uncharacterized membrane protein